ncbi:MAG: zeta toxin [Sedimentisphaerales bacterium]|nr:zeta toxin [Sedimentisphaerales bacterium]
MKKKQKPTCYIIAGPNGAGKTTFALHYLSQIANCCNFVNADLIAYGLSPLDSLSAQYEAGRIFLHEIQAHINKRRDFAFETTLAGRSHINLLKKLRKDGWRIVLFFLWIPDADFSKSRVHERVKHGGHNIPEDAIYRRYPRVIHNFIKSYISLCDQVFCYDNSILEPVLIFQLDNSGLSILNQEIYEKIMRWSDDSKTNQ